MGSIDYKISKNGALVDRGQEKLIATIAEIDPSKALLNDININRDNIMFRLNEVVGLKQNIDQSEVANFYEDDSKQDRFMDNFIAGLSGDYSGDSSTIVPRFSHFHSEFGDALNLGIGEQVAFSGTAAQAVEDFLSALT